MTTLITMLRTMSAIKKRLQYLLVVTRMSIRAIEIFPVDSAIGVNWNATQRNLAAFVTFSGLSVEACFPKPETQETPKGLNDASRKT